MEDRLSQDTKVLVVDDTTLVRRIIVARLRDAGYKVSEAADGQEALDAFRGEPSAVVITDVNMPRLDGLGLLAELRRHTLPPEVPIRKPFPEGEWLVFWVQDRGRGIPPSYHTRIFEKFGQVRGQKVRGTGLGLTFCKLAVEAHGGRIWIEGGAPGAIFCIRLPDA